MREGWNGTVRRQTGIERDKALEAQQRAETSQRSEQEQRQRAETERRRAEKGEAESRVLLYAAHPTQVATWLAEEHAAEQRLAQRRAAGQASEKPESQQP